MVVLLSLSVKRKNTKSFVLTDVSVVLLFCKEKERMKENERKKERKMVKGFILVLIMKIKSGNNIKYLYKIP